MEAAAGRQERGITPIVDPVSVQAGHGIIQLVRGNIVAEDVDAIVNAANTKLAGGGGVDGAIHRAAGPSLLEACRRFPADENGRRCATGDVRVTVAGNLTAKWIIHAVGPFYNARYAEKAHEQLRAVHRRALEEAADRSCRSIAFPAISTGAYRFPIDAAATIALGEAANWLASPSTIRLIRFVLFSDRLFQVFAEAMGKTELTRPVRVPPSAPGVDTSPDHRSPRA